MRHQEVSRKNINRQAVALDSNNQNIQCKDIVKVVDGFHSVGFNSICIEKAIERFTYIF